MTDLEGDSIGFVGLTYIYYCCSCMKNNDFKIFYSVYYLWAVKDKADYLCQFSSFLQLFLGV